MPYTELHLHSCWSLLEGASTPEELVMRALEQRSCSFGGAAAAVLHHRPLGLRPV